ncbi:hypothetical protein TNCV_2816031 [Trichonephila clavipes]|nr:hypothetical protein TNCV_2816031 [Trichonephila clavipes]
MISLQDNTQREILIKSGGIILKIFPCGQDVSSCELRLTTRHDCLLKHLYRIHVAHAPFCTLCDFREDMDADNICRCPALKGSSLCDLYWQARDLLHP